jgi:predicted methyltransferase
MRHLPALFAILGVAAVLSGCASPSLKQAATGDHRPAAHIERNQFRHPVETLRFFDVDRDMTVVEIWPGGAGWYTEVLAPWLRDKGTFYAAQFPPDSDIPFYTRNLEKYRAKLADKPDVYDQVTITYLWPPQYTEIAPPGTADRVLTFRNVHNWAKAGKTDAYFQAFFEALKPGGILGVVEHRAPEGRSVENQIESGYMTEAFVIEAAEKAGFRLEARSEINANPKDNATHPEGVWTLPPTLRLGEQNREQYLAVGESDRMTLRFVKPAQ